VQATDGTDMDVVLAALLHDVVEDTPTSYEDVAANFGGRVAVMALVARVRAGPNGAPTHTNRASGSPIGLAVLSLLRRGRPNLLRAPGHSF
jgi:hypothetical protein